MLLDPNTAGRVVCAPPNDGMEFMGTASNSIFLYWEYTPLRSNGRDEMGRMGGLLQTIPKFEEIGVSPVI